MTDAYPWLLAVGSITSLIWLSLVEPGPERTKTLTSQFSRFDAGLVTLVTGILGARLGFVLMHQFYFSTHTENIFKYWNGGLNWVAGAIGVLLGLGVYAMINRLSFWLLLDNLAIPAMIVAFTAWFGCLLDGCAFGKQADFGFLTPLTPDNLADQLHRWPVQGSGALLTLGLLLILNRLRSTNLPAGVLGSLSLLSISSSSLVLTFFRGDQVPILNGFRSDGVASAILLILSLIAVATRFKVSKEI